MSRPAAIRSHVFVRPNSRVPLFGTVACLLLTTGCWSASESVTSTTGEPSRSGTAPRSDEHALLQNLLRLSKTVYSGGEPHGAAAFAELARLGVKTVVSVDGAKPDVETARLHGLRYVHIPIGYDGVGSHAGGSLARLAREGEGPFYVHCHHGRHRGPAAAAVLCLAAGEASHAEARRMLELAGTSTAYGGLWRDVESYRPPPPDADLPELVAVARVSSFVSAMALLDRAYDTLKRCRDVEWTAPKEHPDLVPAQGALILQEGFHEAGRMLEESSEARLRAWLTEAEELARGLRTALETRHLEAADERFAALAMACTRCHAEYRN